MDAIYLSTCFSGLCVFSHSQSDIVHQSVYELIHTEDRDEFHRQLHWALNPSNPPDTGQLVQSKINQPFHFISRSQADAKLRSFLYHEKKTRQGTQLHCVLRGSFCTRRAF